MDKTALFPPSLKEASVIQRALCKQVIKEDCLTHVRSICGMDVSCQRYDPERKIYAAAFCIDSSTLKEQECSLIDTRACFPYVPGFLGFREAPALIKAYQNLRHPPDLIFVDGHGICHPRGLGIASHVGVLLDLPSIGVAKSILIGTPRGCLGSEVGDLVPLIWKEQEIGILLRTKKRAHPLVISIGHKISLPSAVHFVLNCLKGYRLPEPTRLAHLHSNTYRRKKLGAHETSF